ncbi:Abi family protein [Nonomuraea africana]|uniref:Abi family protein n=2 Tax=Nonomuraea africana TaxID=46171 RepID=A0ABR9KUY6_9ACTN|nr:hypothetical protein [Nonomuraea africana]
MSPEIAWFSAARLAEYHAARHGDREAALRLHCWNTEISSAFYEALQFVEVGLRNAVHHRLQEQLGRVDWWSTLTLHHAGADMIATVEDKLDRFTTSWTPDDVVARLPFGFWVALFGPAYEHPLWYGGLRRALPGYTDRRRLRLHRELESLRLFRNRIAHHRPIYHRHLEADHRSVLRMLGYLSAPLGALVEKHSRVPMLLACRP